MSEKIHVEKQRRELLSKWKQLCNEFEKLDRIVREPVTELTHDDIRNWLKDIDTLTNQIYTLKTQTLDFMKLPENMEILEQNTK